MKKFLTLFIVLVIFIGIFPTNIHVVKAAEYIQRIVLDETDITNENYPMIEYQIDKHGSNSTTFIPFSYISEKMGLEVEYIENYKTVSIGGKNYNVGLVCVNGDKNSISETSGSIGSAYMENGRIMTTYWLINPVARSLLKWSMNNVFLGNGLPDEMRFEINSLPVSERRPYKFEVVSKEVFMIIKDTNAPILESTQDANSYTWLIEPKFFYIEKYFSEGFVTANDGDSNSFFISVDGKTNPVGKNKRRIEGGLISFSNNNGMGLMDSEGKILTDRYYTSIGTFNDGIALARNNSGYFYINKAGKVIIDGSKYKNCYPFKEGRAMVIDVGNKYGFIDETGKLVASGYHELGHFNEGYAAFHRGFDKDEAGSAKFGSNVAVSKGAGFLDKNGNEKMFFHEASAISDFSYGYATMHLEATGPYDEDIEGVSLGFGSTPEVYGRYIVKKPPIYIDKNGTKLEITREQYLEKSGQMKLKAEIMRRTGYSYDDIFFINQSDPTQSTYSNILPDDGFMQFYTLDWKHTGFIDASGKIVSPITPYNEPEEHNEGLAVFKKDGKYGYKDILSGNTVITPQFDEAHAFNEGLAIVKINGKYGVIRHPNSELTSKPEISAQKQAVNIVINNTPLISSVSPYIENGRTMAPLRAVADAFDYEVNWNEAEQKIRLTKGNTTVILSVGDTTIWVNGAKDALSIPPTIKNGTTFLPVGNLAEILGIKVEWDSNTKTAIFTE